MAFGKILANLRKSRGLSQEQLAGELDLTRQTISKWELNQSTPDLDYLVRLSDFFGVSTDYLIKGEQTNNLTPSNDTESEVSDTINIHKQLSGVHAYKWCFYLGLVSMGVSLLGIIAFIICSALNPWTAMVNNMVYQGLFGFLIGTKTLWFFIVLSVLFIAGGFASVYAIKKNMKENNNIQIPNS